MTEHVRLSAGYTTSGSVAYEVLPARRASGDEWVIAGTPALVQGVAAGDSVRVEPDGQFSVVRRGGNVGIVSYAEAHVDLAVAVAALRGTLGDLGHVEVDRSGRWCVATVPVSVGFERIEQLLAEWSEHTGARWSYVNVYDEEDRPLNWWS